MNKIQTLTIDISSERDVLDVLRRHAEYCLEEKLEDIDNQSMLDKRALERSQETIENLTRDTNILKTENARLTNILNKIRDDMGALSAYTKNSI